MKITFHLGHTLLVAMTASVSYPAVGEGNSTPTQSQPYTDDRSWMTQPWTSSDAPFLSAEKEVARAQKTRLGLPAMLSTYRKAALANLTQPRSIYKWVYAAQKVMATRPRKERESQWEKISDSYPALMRPMGPQHYIIDTFAPQYRELYQAHKLPSPLRSYRFSRLAFIVAVNQRIYASSDRAESFAELGERLLRKNPKDAEVKALMVTVCRYSWLERGTRHQVNFDKALRYANELVRDYPQNYGYILLVAQAQRNLWQYRKNNIGADKAIATYQKYLRMAPPNHPDRKWAIYQISSLENSKSFWTNWRRTHPVS